MKHRALKIIIGLMVAACSFTACLDSESTVYEPSHNAAITAFAIADSIVTRYPAIVNGKDTTLTTGIVGSKYPFAIDQTQGQIYNPDSLPVGTDISRVKVSISADGYGIYIAAEKDTLWQETDSLDFNQPVQFKVLAQDGNFGRVYTARINVHQQDPEAMGWTRIASNFHRATGAMKAVLCQGSMHVLTEQPDGVFVTSSTDGTLWTEPVSIDTPKKADIHSAMVWGKQLYILAQGELYTSADARTWSRVDTEQRFSALMAGIHTEHVQKLVATDIEGRYTESTDGKTWLTLDNVPEGFPKQGASAVAYALDTNENLGRMVLMGGNEAGQDSTTVAWTVLTTETQWTELTPPDAASACPKLENLTLIRYNGSLYAMGGAGRHGGEIAPFSAFYRSDDNGITWAECNKGMTMAEEFEGLYEAADGNYTCIVDDEDCIWLFWGNTGEVWRGRLNKLGFERK